MAIEESDLLKAHEMALELRTYCETLDISPDMLMHGVAWNAEAVHDFSYRKGFIEGQRKKAADISDKLGLTTYVDPYPSE